MKTIKSLINETVKQRQAAKQIECDDRIASIYNRNPELSRIDQRIVVQRSERLVGMLDGKLASSEVRNEEENELLAKRIKYLSDNNIAMDFDVPTVVCNECNDTGVKVLKSGLKMVCGCMKAEIRECAAASGMTDFDSIAPENLYNDVGEGTARRKQIIADFSQIVVGRKTGTFIFCDSTSKGKTYIAVCALKNAISMFKSVYYIKAEDLADVDKDLIDDLKDVQILVIDDFRSYTTGIRAVAQNMIRLLEVRSSRDLATIIITNETINELLSDSDERVAGKLKFAQKIPSEK